MRHVLITASETCFKNKVTVTTCWINQTSKETTAV